MKTNFSLAEQLEMVDAEIKANIETVGFAIRLNELRQKRNALEVQIHEELEDELMFESERGGPDMDGCAEYARRFAPT